MAEADDQLREALVFHGVQVGPIVGSTREFYKKLLARHLNGDVAKEEVKENSEEESSEEDQPAAVVRVSPMMYRGNFPATCNLTQKSPKRATLLTTTSPVAGDPTWGLRRRLLLDEERQQVAEVYSGRWSPTSAQGQFGGEEKEEDQVVRKVEVKVDRQGLGIIEWSKQALIFVAKFVLVLVILYIILIISYNW